MHINLFCKVGRAAPQPIGTFEGPDAEANCSACQSSKTAELLASGTDLSRVKFERVTVGAASKKGK